MKASNYLPLLKELKAKRQCLNIQSNDEKYFLWSSLALLYPVQCRNHSDGVSNYQEHKRELNMSRIKYPIDIKILANSNTKTILVLMDAKIKKIFPLCITNMAVARHHVNLLYITTEEKSHYKLVKDLSRLPWRQFNNDNNKK